MARNSGLLLTALILAFYAAMAAAGRPQPILQSSAAGGLARALGVSAGTGIGCCTCLCTLIYPPEANICVCGGVFESCPAFCEGSCTCEGSLCTCGKTLSYAVCTANLCDASAASAHADAA